MFCPNCGKANSSEQKFCRSCGLNLEDSARSVIAQLPAVESDQRLARRKALVEKTLVTMGGLGLGIFGTIVIWKIVTDIILDKGQVAGGIVAVAFVLAMAAALALVIYRQFLIEATSKRSRQTDVSAEEPLPAATIHQLADSYFEPVPSVTEPTTDLLNTSPKTRRDG